MYFNIFNTGTGYNQSMVTSWPMKRLASTWVVPSLSDLTWSEHIKNTTNKASRSLGFLHRNLHIKSLKIKEQAYKSLVRPQLELCHHTTVWDPYHKNHIDKIEKVQRRAARYVHW